ncbi:hypothetical protein B0H15DRAFT_427586 [Mycena belliarum]|uniref:DUF6699 domain-containing protein n=1 Tax=Mycena belliarum TaxID=1033014 RepID=A0AAD6U321_9AGAR|nr:hypothetical protein B0H15DRAFT_427586 [Mycena belliae]
MQIAIREVLDAVEQEVRQLPPGRHIFPCLIMTEDGAYRFAPSGYRWDEFHQAGTRRERPTEGRRENIEAPVEPLPIPSDDGFTRADSNLECDAEDPTPDNFINIDPPDASAAAPESHVSFGGLPPWRGRPAWPSGPLNCPAISPNPLQPNLGAAVSMLALAPQTPVLYSRNRTVHIPTLPAHEWGTLYAHRRVTPRVPRRPILTPLRPAQFLMPPPQRDRNLINPDLSGPINWRVFLPPSTARMSTRRGGPLLQGPATSPPCFCAAIMFENPSLMHWAQRWGPIRVPVHSRTITVGDVLDAVHDYASQPLTQTDLALVVPEDRKKIDQGGRLRQLRGHPHVPVPLRSDVFNNTVMFGGMRVINVSAPGSYISLRLLPDLDW